MPMYRPRFLDRVSSKFSKSASLKKGTRKGSAKVREVARAMSESLEARRLLTTIVTPDPNTGATVATFTFKSIVQIYPDLIDAIPDGRFVEIQQSGNTDAEYVGAFTNELGETEITNLPGVFGTGAISNGGLGGEQGTQLYGQDDIIDTLNPALSYDPYNLTGNTGLKMDALAAYVNSGGGAVSTGELFGINLATSTTPPTIQIVEFPNSTTNQIDPRQTDPLFDQTVNQFATDDVPAAEADLDTAPRGNGFVAADIQLPDPAVPLPPDPLGLKRDGTTPAATDPAAVTAAAFNPIDGRLYFIVVGNGPTKFNELYSVFVDPNTGAISDLEKSLGQFGAIPMTQASGGAVAIPATTDQVSAITFHQTSDTTSTMFAFEVFTAPVLPSLGNPTGGPGTAEGFLAQYRFTSNAQNFSVAGQNGKQVAVITTGIGDTTEITGLSFENDIPDVAPAKIFASTSSKGPASGTGGTGGTAEQGELIRIDLTQPQEPTFPAVVIADLANPLAEGSSFELGADIQDLVWEPDAFDPVLDFNALGQIDVDTPSGAFVGTDAESNELAVISVNPRPAGEYLYSVFVAQGNLSNSVISVASPADSEYDVITGVPAAGAPSGPLSPDAGSSGDVLVAATGLNTADGFSRAPAGSGYAYLGLKSGDLAPITDAETTGIGLIPATQDLQAGFETAPGVEIESFLFGGTVTGNVDFQGNAYTFYSGWLITGNSQGNGGSEFELTINGTPTSGDYTLLVTTETGSEATTPPPNLTFNSPASDVQTALQDVGIISQFGADAVTVTGPDGGPYIIQFAAGLGVVTLTLDGSSLVPAGTPAVTIATIAPSAGLEASDDLRNVWVQSDAGGEPTPGFVADAAFDTTDIDGNFNSGLAPSIFGHIDQFRVVDNLQGAITVNDADAGFGINDEIDPDTGAPFVQNKLLSYVAANGTLLGTDFADGGIPEPDGIFNNTFATPQYLGALSTANPVVTLDGALNGVMPALPDPADNVNYYAVAVLAGQTITVQVTDDGTFPLDVGVFDPDGRLVASDYSVDQGSGVFGNVTENKPFQFTAKMPGSYRFAISGNGDDATGGAAPFSGSISVPAPPASPIAYTLRVGDAVDILGNTLPVTGKTGDIALGGLITGSVTGSVEAANGDIGAVHADGSILSFDSIVDVGNLRDVDASDIGAKTITNGEQFTDAMLISVPVGGVGLLRATSTVAASGSLYVEPLDLDQTILDPVDHQPYIGQAVGTTIQVVDAASSLACDLVANDAIGTVQSGDQAVSGKDSGPGGSPPLSGNDANSFAVNPDNNTSIAGRIDLIDCVGDFGTLQEGGPAITTGPNGDVKFINVGGTVYEDNYFGEGLPAQTIHDPGVSVTLNDDSGAVITLTPQGTFTPNPAYNASAPAAGVSAMLGPALNVTTYGIRGSGGVVIINVTVTDGGSLLVTSAGSATSQVAEITNIVLQNEGPLVLPTSTAATTVTNASTGVVSNVSNSTISSPALSTTAPAHGNTSPDSNIVPFELDPASTASMTVTINGTNNVDLYDVTGYTDATETTLANFTSIINNTNGEIVNVNAASVGVLKSGGPIGVPITSTPAALYPARIISSDFPFDEQRYGIVVAGNAGGNGGIVQLISGSAIGNVLVTGGSIGSIIANSGHVGEISGLFAGIDGPIVVTGLYEAGVPGQIQSVDIGQGILSSGTGTVSFAGLYASGAIGLVTNSEAGAEIRGSIVSETEVNAVILRNASIIDAEVDAISNFTGSDQLPTPFIDANLSFSQEEPIWTIGQITIVGDGGMTGDMVQAGSIGPTLLSSGSYGMFFSNYITAGDGEIDFATASGYGIRDSFFEGGASLAGLNATGNGSLLNTDTIDPALFVSRLDTSTLTVFNPFSGLLPSQLDDLDTMLQTGTSDPNIAGRTDTGSIEDTIGVGDRNLGSLTAQTIREVAQVDSEGAPLLPNPTTVGTDIPGTTGSFGSDFNYANSIGSVKVRGGIDGLELTSGKIAAFNALSIARMGITVSGTIQNMLIRGNYGMPVQNGAVSGGQVAAGDSFIQAIGPHGVIGKLTITGNLDGTIFAEGSILALTVYGSVRGNVTSEGESRGLSLGTLHVGAFLDQSSLDITGSVGSIIANGGFGVLGDTLTITGNLGSLQVGALGRNTNNSLGMVLTVLGSVGKVNVRGHIDGSIQVGKNLTSLSVTNDGSSSSLINGPVNVDGTIGSISLTNGNAVSSITASGSIGSVSLHNGSVLAGSSFQSASGSIRSFSISGGATFGLFGSVLAPKGVNEAFKISGNVGDGVDPALVTALTGTTFHVVGSIENNATIQFTGSLGLLQVDGNIYTGAVISADPLKKQKIQGTNTGSISVI